jgi:uncharacterized protein YciI
MPTTKRVIPSPTKHAIVPHRDQHLKSIDQLRQSGQAKILGAPFFPYTGAAMILETEQEKQQVESVIQNDPYVKNKIVSKWSVKEFEGTTVETRRKFDRIAGDFTFRS